MIVYGCIIPLPRGGNVIKLSLQTKRVIANVVRQSLIYEQIEPVVPPINDGRTLDLKPLGKSRRVFNPCPAREHQEMLNKQHRI
jgi:hypothetical protein